MESKRGFMKKSLIISVLLLLLITGCDTNSNLLGEPTSIPSPEPGKANVYGKVLSEEGEPQAEITVRLATVFRNEDQSGAYVLDEASSPSAVSGENGEFFFENIEPGEYVIFVGALYSDYKIISEGGQEPIVYEVVPGEVLTIEPIIADFD